jgi:hypothetical protein
MTVVWLGLALALHHGVPSAFGAEHEHGFEAAVECPAVLSDDLDVAAPQTVRRHGSARLWPVPRQAMRVERHGRVSEIVSRAGPPLFRRLCVDRR